MMETFIVLGLCFILYEALDFFQGCIHSATTTTSDQIEFFRRQIDEQQRLVELHKQALEAENKEDEDDDEEVKDECVVKIQSANNSRSNSNISCCPSPIVHHQSNNNSLYGSSSSLTRSKNRIYPDKAPEPTSTTTFFDIIQPFDSSTSTTSSPLDLKRATFTSESFQKSTETVNQIPQSKTSIDIEERPPKTQRKYRNSPLSIRRKTSLSAFSFTSSSGLGDSVSVSDGDYLNDYFTNQSLGDDTLNNRHKNNSSDTLDKSVECSCNKFSSVLQNKKIFSISERI